MNQQDKDIIDQVIDNFEATGCGMVKVSDGYVLMLSTEKIMELLAASEKSGKAVLNIKTTSAPINPLIDIS